MFALSLIAVTGVILSGCGDSATNDVAGGSANAATSNSGTVVTEPVNSPTNDSANSATNETNNAGTAASNEGGMSAEQASMQSGTTPDGTYKPKDGEEVAIIETTQGRIIFGFLSDKAPKTVENFKTLAKKGFYDKTAFHRVIPGFMIQGGDPNTKPGASGMPGTGGPGYSVKAEFNDVKHVPGVVSMARSSDPDSAGSQFFIMVNAYPSLDGQYTAFGRVISGQNVADKIVALQTGANDMPQDIEQARVKSIRIAKWPVK